MGEFIGECKLVKDEMMLERLPCDIVLERLDSAYEFSLQHMHARSSLVVAVL
jgi:hypothetical protein